MMRSQIAALTCLWLAAADCRDDANLFTLDGPISVTLFQVHDGNGTVLWRITSAQPRSLSEIRYGRVPRGFTQIVPASGTEPKPFRSGEKLVLLVVSPEAIYRHEGVATGRDQCRGGYGETGPLSPERLKDALEGRPITRDK
jgi:hypothetical protein